MFQLEVLIRKRSPVDAGDAGAVPLRERCRSAAVHSKTQFKTPTLKDRDKLSPKWELHCA